MTLCAGAVRDWLLERDALPEDPLVAMIPMSVRKRDERGAWGNRISMMIVPIPTNEPDPATRLRRTHELPAQRQGAPQRAARLAADRRDGVHPARGRLARRAQHGRHPQPHPPAAEPRDLQRPGPADLALLRGRRAGLQLPVSA